MSKFYFENLSFWVLSHFELEFKHRDFQIFLLLLQVMCFVAIFFTIRVWICHNLSYTGLSQGEYCYETVWNQGYQVVSGEDKTHSSGLILSNHELSPFEFLSCQNYVKYIFFNLVKKSNFMKYVFWWKKFICETKFLMKNLMKNDKLWKQI